MPKLSKTAGIELIVAELKKGTAKVTIMANFGKQWQTPKDTFNKWWIIALEQHNKAQEALNKVKKVQEVVNKINELKTASLTKLDRIIIAESIAMAKAKKVNGQIIVPTPNDQLKALDYLAKINADYAPIKTETEVTVNKSEVLDWVVSKKNK